MYYAVEYVKFMGRLQLTTALVVGDFGNSGKEVESSQKKKMHERPSVVGKLYCDRNIKNHPSPILLVQTLQCSSHISQDNLLECSAT